MWLDIDVTVLFFVCICKVSVASELNFSFIKKIKLTSNEAMKNKLHKQETMCVYWSAKQSILSENSNFLAESSSKLF